MKNCPNCGELLGDTVMKCIECFFDMSDPEQMKQLEEKKKIEKEEEEKRKREEEEKRISAIKEKNARIFSMNNLYEYAVETVSDTENGTSNKTAIIAHINRYAKNGWRLHSIYTNEIGKISQPKPFGISTINATIEETVMIFERIVDKANQ